MEGTRVMEGRENDAGWEVEWEKSETWFFFPKQEKRREKWEDDDDATMDITHTQKHGFPFPYVCTLVCLALIPQKKPNTPDALSFTRPRCRHTHVYRCTTSRRGRTLATTTARWRRSARQRAHEGALTSDVGHEEHGVVTHNAPTRA